MFYKPNYCCNCGEKIERIEWYPWTNRRFCEICETDYQVDDWIKRIFPTLFLLFGIFGIGSYFQGNGKTVDVTKTEIKGNLQTVQQPRTLKSGDTKKLPDKVNKTRENISDKRTFDNQKETNETIQPLEQNVATTEKRQNVVIASSQQKTAKQSVYFCGAQTKKGTPCSRKVKGGGRCWQHEGREAMLTIKELKAEN